MEKGSGFDPVPSFWSGRVIVVTGGAGFLGKPVVRMVEGLGAEVRVPRSSEHDLTDPVVCREALEGADVVLHLAAHVGGIGFNSCNPAPLAHDNLAMGLNVFEACRQLQIEKLVAVSSVCAYPKDMSTPFTEDGLWDGYPEETNAPYALAKRMLGVLSDAYRHQYDLNSCVPVMANLYGPGDDFDLERSHVLAAMVRKYVEAEESGATEVSLWGSGRPTREFLYVDDAARALLLAAEHADFSEPFNIGTGVETRISELAEMVAAAVGYEGRTVWDASRPDGQSARRLDVSRAWDRLGFRAQTSLDDGIVQTVASFRRTGEIDT